jgi:RNA polymerase sigma factor (TIGR02999 family)
MDKHPELVNPAAPAWWDESLANETRELADKLLPLFYDELRRLAHRERARFGASATLPTTALVHEAYLKLRGTPGWNDDSHFLRAASLSMRHALVNHALARQTDKRGAGAEHVSLDAALDLAIESDERLLAIDAVLTRLALDAPRLAQVVECRYFGGCSDAETARALGVSESTVRRDWRLAQAWLYRELGGP